MEVTVKISSEPEPGFQQPFSARHLKADNICYPGDSRLFECCSKKNERLTSLNIELQEKLLQQIKDTESGAREIARISKEVQEHTKQVGVLSGGAGAHQTGRCVVRRCRSTPNR